MNKRIVLTLLLFGCQLAWAQPDLLDEEYARLDADFAAILSEEGIPGGAYVIVREGKIDHVATWGVRASGEHDPVTPDTVFRIASVSKTFAAQLTAMVVNDGILDWDDPVVRFVPEFSLRNAEHARQLRLHHLLSQSTGIVSNAYDNLLNASQRLDQIVPQFAQLEPMCAPGECYTYQNVLFAMVGPAIEQATGRSYEDLLGERVFMPLCMSSASTGLDAWLATDNRARPHVRRGTVWWPTEVNVNYYNVAPAAGVNASITDLGQWLIAQLGHRPGVIDPLLVEQLTAKRVRTLRDLRRRNWRDLLDDAHYGLGWRIYTVGGEDIFLHSGWVRGFVAEVGYSRDRQVGIAVVLNAESSALNRFTTHFWRQALSEPRLVADRDRSSAGPGQ